MDMLICIECENHFDNLKKVPRVLINCGHSLCEECLMEHFNQKVPIRCVEDNLTLDVENFKMENFPVNQGLCKILENNFNTNIDKQLKDEDLLFDSSMSRDDNIIQEDSTVQDSVLTQKNKKNKEKFIRKESIDQRFFCIKHRMKLELYCIDCNLKICYNCAVGNVHQNHEFLQEDEFSQKVKDIRNNLKEVGDQIDHRIQKLNLEVIKKISSTKFKVKKAEFLGQINDFFQVSQQE